MLNIKSSRQSGEILDGASLRQILSRIRRKVSRQKQRLHELSTHSTSSSRRRYRSRFSVSIFSRCLFPRDAQTRAIVSKNGRARSRHPPDSSLRTIATVSAISISRISMHCIVVLTCHRRIADCGRRLLTSRRTDSSREMEHAQRIKRNQVRFILVVRCSFSIFHTWT